MKQLTMGDLKAYIEELESNDYDLNTIPVYLGNDDELNGIHNGWCITLLDKKDLSEDTQYFISMINEDYGNTELKSVGILIS